MKTANLTAIVISDLFVTLQSPIVVAQMFNKQFQGSSLHYNLKGIQRGEV